MVFFSVGLEGLRILQFFSKKSGVGGGVAKTARSALPTEAGSGRR